MINSGYMELMASAGQVIVRLYYDNTIGPELPQPLINGPRGFCLDLTNTSGKARQVTFTLPDGTVNTVAVGPGDPVRSKSLTAAELNALGYFYRADVNGLILE